MIKFKKTKLNSNERNKLVFFKEKNSAFEDEPLKNQLTIEELFSDKKESGEPIVSVDDIVSGENRARELASAEEHVNAQNTTKSKLWSFIFLVINLVIVAIIFLTQLEADNVTSPADLKIDWLWMTIAGLMFFIIVFTEQIRYLMLIKSSTNRHRPFLSYKLSAVGKYYDAITPFSAGGQPFQVYYLNNRGVKASTAISVPLAKFIMQQIIFTIVASVFLFGNLGMLAGFSGAENKVVTIACWIGYICNFVVIATVVIISISKKVGHKLVSGVLKLLTKIRIVKDYDKQYNKVMKLVADYQNTIKFFAKSPLVMIFSMFLSLVALLAQYSVIYFIFKAFGGVGGIETWFEVVGIAVMIDLAIGFIPLPGGSGMSEFAFTMLFGNIGGNELIWALLIWRFITYYSFILQGIGVVIYDTIIGNKKNIKMVAMIKEEDRQKLENQQT